MSTSVDLSPALSPPPSPAGFQVLVCIAHLLSYWIFEQLHELSICLRVIVLLIVCSTWGTWVLAFGLQETWKKRTVPAPKSLQFEYKIFNRWKQIRTGWGKSTKKAKEVILLYCWDTWAGLASGSNMEVHGAKLSCSKCWIFLIKKPTATKTQIPFQPQGIWIAIFLFILLFHFHS